MLLSCTEFINICWVTATIISCVRRRKLDDQVLTINSCCCHGQLAPFPVATCFPLRHVSKAREIAGDDFVITENEESCLRQHRDFKSKTSSPK